MKVINTNQSVTIPEDVDASVKSRVVTVKGPRGTLIKSFKHLAVDISMPDKKTVRVEKWFGKKKELAAVRTVCSHISNLCKGVTQVRQVPKSFKTRFNSSDLFSNFQKIFYEMSFEDKPCDSTINNSWKHNDF